MTAERFDPTRHRRHVTRLTAHTAYLLIHRRAENLISSDETGTSDPYIKLKLGGVEHRSQVVKKTTTPVWDEAFEFSGTLGALSADALTLTVHDHDGISFDDSLGEAKVPLGNLAVGYAEELTVALEGKKATGEVRIDLSWVDAEAEAPRRDGAGARAAVRGGQPDRRVVPGARGADRAEREAGAPQVDPSELRDHALRRRRPRRRARRRAARSRAHAVGPGDAVAREEEAIIV